MGIVSNSLLKNKHLPIHYFLKYDHIHTIVLEMFENVCKKVKFVYIPWRFRFGIFKIYKLYTDFLELVRVSKINDL